MQASYDVLFSFADAVVVLIQLLLRFAEDKDRHLSGFGIQIDALRKDTTHMENLMGLRSPPSHDASWLSD